MINFVLPVRVVGMSVPFLAWRIRQTSHFILICDCNCVDTYISVRLKLVRKLNFTVFLAIHIGHSLVIYYRTVKSFVILLLFYAAIYFPRNHMTTT